MKKDRNIKIWTASKIETKIEKMIRKYISFNVNPN
jgi:hypothetical protein